MEGEIMNAVSLNGGVSFVWQCVQELLVWDVIIPAFLIVGVLIACWAIRLHIELEEDKDEQ
jgi:hypothetical protein